VTRLRAQGGTASVEFLIAFVPFFVLFLGGVQLALLASARIVVEHAAVSAARAAVLAIDDDPYFHRREGTRRKLLSEDAQGGKLALPGGLSQHLDASASTGDGGEGRGCSRLSQVRRAAYLPLSVLAPLTGIAGSGLLPVALAPDHLEGTLSGPWARVLFGFFVYGRMATALTFPVSPGSDDLRDLGQSAQPFADDDVVTARVSYLYSCEVPLARALVCDALLELQANSELEVFEHAEWSLPTPLLLGERFLVLSAEASLPNQGAPYEYASELCKTRDKLAHCGGGS
jgi:hypothetical protein